MRSGLGPRRLAQSRDARRAAGSSHLFGITDLLVSQSCGAGEVVVVQDDDAEAGVVAAPSVTRREPPRIFRSGSRVKARSMKVRTL